MKSGFIKQVTTTVKTENKVSVSYKLLNSVMKSDHAALY